MCIYYLLFFPSNSIYSLYICIIVNYDLNQSYIYFLPSVWASYCWTFLNLNHMLSHNVFWYKYHIFWYIWYSLCCLVLDIWACVLILLSKHLIRVSACALYPPNAATYDFILCLRKLIFIFILCLHMSFYLVVVIQRNYIIYRFIIIYEFYHHHKFNYTLFLWHFLGLSGFSLFSIRFCKLLLRLVNHIFAFPQTK